MDNKPTDNGEWVSVGDRVTRSKLNAFRYSKGDGVVISIDEFGRCKIKWDKKASTGQQHSTIQSKFLIKLPSPPNK